MSVIDSHFHCWQLSRGDYGWLTPELGPIYRDVDVPHWKVEASPHGVTKGMLVQAAPTEAETQFLLQLADEYADDIAGVVGWHGLMSPDAPKAIVQLAKHPKLKGLRPMLQDIADPDWILQPQLAPALAAMAQAGLVFDALIKPVHLPRIATLAERHPGLMMVVDHGAKPDIAGTGWRPWADGAAQLAAKHPHVCCKLSGMLTEAGPGARAVEIAPWIAHLLKCFGPERLIWGSDWPVLELASTYPAWWAMVQGAIAHLAPRERQAILGGNARRVYRLDETHISH